MRQFYSIALKKKHIALHILGAILSFIVLTSCNKKEDNKHIDRSLSSFYYKGIDNLQKKSYLQAATSLYIFHNKYSYSSWSLKAQLLSSYSYYQKKFYSEAVITLESFIRLNDNNKYLPYAYFLQGVCYYEQISYSLRDRKFMDLAEVTFKNLIKRFPKSLYSKAAYKNLSRIYTRMATHEIKVGCFYQKKYLWSAAINRFQGIIKKNS